MQIQSKPTSEWGKPQISLDAESLYQFGHMIRETDRLLLELFSQGLLSGTTHTSIGQEFCQMAVVRALNHPTDVVLSNHRNHGHLLTYCGDVAGLLAEVMGKERGICHGRGGSQHVLFRRFLSNGIQAGMTAIGVGYGLALSLRSQDGVVAIMVGDGTIGQGLLYESMNLASVWSLPLLFVLENNQIAQTTPTRDTIGGTLAGRGPAFGLRSWELDDTEVDFFEKAEAAVTWVRSSRQPGWLIINTRRLAPHSKGDDLRSAAEMEEMWRKDPLAQLGTRLDETVRRSIELRNQQSLQAALQEARTSAEANWDRVPSSIFKDHPLPLNADSATPQAPCTVRKSLNQALRKLLEEDESVILLGQDLHDPYGGAFKVTAGLSSEFPRRVLSTPISEAATVGTAIGLSMEGLRPIVEIMFADFLTLALDQIYNHAVKLPAHLMIRAPNGGGRGYGPTHSQSPEGMFASVPGLTVICASHRHDCGRLLRAACQQWPYPVLFLEHKLLYAAEQSAADYLVVPPCPQDAASSLFPTLRRGHQQPDVTLVTYGGMVPVVEEAVKQLEQEELSWEIVVPSLLSPLPVHTLVRPLCERKRVVIVEEGPVPFGVGAEISASLVELGFRGTVKRIGLPPIPIPSARSLEKQVVPDGAAVVSTVLSMF